MISLQSFCNEPDTVHFNKLADLFRATLRSDIDSARLIAKAYNSEARSANYDKAIAQSLNFLAICDIYAAKYDSAIVTLNKSVQIIKKLKSPRALEDAYSNLGVCYDYKGDLPNALHFYMQSLRIAEMLKDEEGIAKSSNNIGTLYFQNKNFLVADQYFKRSLAIREKLKDPYGIASCCLNIASCSEKINRSGEIAGYLDRCIENAKIAQDSSLLADAYVNYGQELVRQQKYDAALKMFRQALDIDLAFNDPRSLSATYENIGRTLLEQHKNDEALPINRKAYQLAASIGDLSDVRQAAGTLLANFAALRQTDSVMYYFEKYHAASDSLYSAQNSRELTEMQTKYETEKKNAENVILQSRSEIAESNVKKQRNVIILVLIILIIAVISAFIIYKGYKDKKSANLELARLNNRITESRDQVEMQKTLLEVKQKEIVDSINYAKHLLDAILPSPEALTSALPDHFLLYQPKDIVAGDFYWLHQNDAGGRFIIAVADCTGHGVPGAMVSVVCSNALNSAVLEFGLTYPGQILDKVRELIVKTFATNKNEVRDGMDISICAVQKQPDGGIQLEFAGAHNPLLYYREAELREIAADKQPVGRHFEETPFKTQKLELAKGDLVYMLTDGFADQFGGPAGKKFKFKNVKQLLSEISSLPLAEQHSRVRQALFQWQGNLEQVDDITLLGFRV